MNNLVWILPKEKSVLFKNKGISREYLIPEKYYHCLKKLKAFSKILIFLKNGSFRLLLIISVAKVEKILSGINKNDFIVTADPANSLKTGSDFQDIKEFEFSLQISGNSEVFLIDEKSSQRILKTILSKPVVKLLKPDPLKKIEKIKYRHLFLMNEKPEYYVNTINENLNLNDVWQCANSQDNGPFSDFAVSLYENILIRQATKNEVKNFTDYDPFKNLILNKKKNKKKTFFKHNQKEIYHLEIENIVARKFICGSPSLIDAEKSLLKTEEAEKRHQEILRDICISLVKKQIKPYFNELIDLLFFKNNYTFIVEIKSCNKKNLISQTSKGLLQLVFIKNEFKNQLKNIKPILILEKTHDDEREKRIKSSLCHAGITVISFDETKLWLERLEDLFNFEKRQHE